MYGYDDTRIIIINISYTEEGETHLFLNFDSMGFFPKVPKQNI